MEGQVHLEAEGVDDEEGEAQDRRGEHHVGQGVAPAQADEAEGERGLDHGGGQAELEEPVRRPQARGCEAGRRGGQDAGRQEPAAVVEVEMNVEIGFQERDGEEDDGDEARDLDDGAEQGRHSFISAIFATASFCIFAAAWSEVSCPARTLP